MSTVAKSLLLFTLNWLDGQLTLFWVHFNLASEGNTLMNELLKLGDLPFIAVKIAIGAFAALTLYRFAHLPLARRGMRLVLTIYSILMLVHLATGMSALGWSQPLAVVTYITHLPSSLITMLS